MKKQFGKNAFYLGSNNDLLVSLVSNEPNGDNNHHYDFVIYDLAMPVQNVGLVGVKDAERFAFKFQMQHSKDRFAFAAYVDGVSVRQDCGLVHLSSINNEESYNSHDKAMLIGSSDRLRECLYLETFVQESSQSRRLAFTLNEKKGVNFNLISDASAMSKIEVFCWIERKVTQPHIQTCTRSLVENTRSVDGNTRSAVGAGEATYKQYEETTTLSNPLYIGKATFIHMNAAVLIHLGDRIVEKPGEFTFNPVKQDIMDLVPQI